MRTQFGALHSDCTIYIRDFITARVYLITYFVQKDFRVNAFICGIGVGEQFSYITQRQSAQSGVAYSVYRYISIRVGNTPLCMRNLNSAQYKTQTIAKCVYVITLSYSYIHNFNLFVNPNINLLTIFGNASHKVEYIFHLILSSEIVRPDGLIMAVTVATISSLVACSVLL